jgi:hypothetical protein
MTNDVPENSPDQQMHIDEQNCPHDGESATGKPTLAIPDERFISKGQKVNVFRTYRQALILISQEF